MGVDMGVVAVPAARYTASDKERYMQCPKCGLENPPGTASCDCGYDFSTGEVVRRTTMQPQPGGSQGFDFGEYFSFRQMVSNSIIKILYFCGAIIICILSLVAVVRGVTATETNVRDVLGGAALLFVGNLLWRVVCEGLILMFSIHEVLVSIEHQGARSFIRAAK
jgi:hypothetical protein